MNDRVEGIAREIGGRVQEGVGKVTGDAQTEAQGQANRVTGQAQQAAAQFGDVIKAQPIVSALVAVAIGYVLGRLTA
jgi:uncharacterized protein YjbJ (UPF0337 family)